MAQLCAPSPVEDATHGVRRGSSGRAVGACVGPSLRRVCSGRAVFAWRCRATVQVSLPWSAALARIHSDRPGSGIGPNFDAHNALGHVYAARVLASFANSAGLQLCSRPNCRGCAARRNIATTAQIQVAAELLLAAKTENDALHVQVTARHPRIRIVPTVVQSIPQGLWSSASDRAVAAVNDLPISPMPAVPELIPGFRQRKRVRTGRAGGGECKGVVGAHRK